VHALFFNEMQVWLAARESLVYAGTASAPLVVALAAPAEALRDE
jgi:hypothetical protein